jgi:hypothetical protein
LSIVVIHLTDIHIRDIADPVFERVVQIKRAVLSHDPCPEACFIVTSGDIANKGLAQEYDAAREFFEDLKKALLEAHVSQVEFIFVPGNHDLDLTDEVDTRQYVLDSVDKYVSKPIELTGLTYDAVMSVQGNFFNFEAQARRSIPVADAARLYFKRNYTVGERTFVFHCFNTSWLSRKHEIQAKLYLPPQIFTNDDAAPDVSIGVFHHPYNWLNAENAHEFKNFIESTADFALTGHEHAAGGSRQLNLTGENLDYIQGAALRDPQADASGFQVLSIDFEASAQTLRRYSWNGAIFTEEFSKAWELSRNARRRSRSFSNTPTFLHDLHSIGIGLHHPRCMPPHCELKLRDLFVYPNLRHQNLDYKITREGEPSKIIAGNKIVTFIQDKKKVVIFGTEDSGKTALAKILYDDLRSDDAIPIAINGEALRSRSKPGQIDNAISVAIQEQYLDTVVEEIRQLDATKRVLILDDFDKARFVKSTQETVIQYLGQFFGSIVIFASDLMQLEDLARGSDVSPFRGFEFCNLREFGRFHRQKLIHKWLHLGREDEEEFESLDKEVRASDKTIATLLGKNVLPHFPVTILTLLQLLETRESANTANGAYGYLYEVLIKAALARVGGGGSDVDAKITYLSGLGYALFKKRDTYLTEDEFRTAHDVYCERYDMTRDFSKMASDFLRSEVLTEKSGEYRFKYPYIYYYAVAKYLHENTNTLRETLHNIADHIYNETNANILIFYVYLTKDQGLIERVVANSKLIFAQFRPCDMSEDVRMFNQMYKLTPPPLELDIESASENRDNHNIKQDAQDELDDHIETPSYDNQVKYTDDLDGIVRIQIAFRTLQILGQMLRNFTGSLPKELKLEITNECYSLGMRILSFVFYFSGIQLDELRQYVGSLVAERTGICDMAELATRTDLAIIWMSCVAAFGCIKRVSYAVGHSDLSKTYGRVLAANKTLATEMIDATIKLDHFDRMPEAELRGIAAKVKENSFAAHVMRDLVADYLYLYEHDAKVMQTLGSMWRIKVNTPRMLASSLKK